MTPADIVQAVADRLDVTPSDIMIDRSKKNAWQRKIVMHLLRDLLGFSYENVADLFGASVGNVYRSMGIPNAAVQDHVTALRAELGGRAAGLSAWNSPISPGWAVHDLPAEPNAHATTVRIDEHDAGRLESTAQRSSGAARRVTRPSLKVDHRPVSNLGRGAELLP